jgi:hypothetical protein
MKTPTVATQADYATLLFSHVHLLKAAKRALPSVEDVEAYDILKTAIANALSYDPDGSIAAKLIK